MSNDAIKDWKLSSFDLGLTWNSGVSIFKALVDSKIEYTTPQAQFVNEQWCKNAKDPVIFFGRNFAIFCASFVKGQGDLQDTKNASFESPSRVETLKMFIYEFLI